jgi:GNAT superfamily N-acetyltransferase
MPTDIEHHDPGELQVPMPLLTGTHWIESLQDGTRVLIRPLQPDDREREQDFIRGLSGESRRYRFLCDIAEASPAMLRQLMDVDYVQRMAFVALAHEDGKLKEVGVSRYSATADASRCECAVTVTDHWRHRGLGVLLMRHLIKVARSNGFRQMFSIDAAENEPMRELARYLGFRRSLDPDDASQVIHTLDLTTIPA